MGGLGWDWTAAQASYSGGRADGSNPFSQMPSYVNLASRRWFVRCRNRPRSRILSALLPPSQPEGDGG
jgi:hypothetical protein